MIPGLLRNYGGNNGRDLKKYNPCDTGESPLLHRYDRSFIHSFMNIYRQPT